MAFSFAWIVTAWYLFVAATRNATVIRLTESDWKPSQSWAQYSPWFPAAPYQQPPDGCSIVQVNILQRHGARFPTAGAGARIVASVAKLQSVKIYEDPSLEFLSNFTYDLGTDNLVPLGAEQSYDAGHNAFKRYSRLVTQNTLPFVRSSGSTRVVDSANNWTSGFSAASNDVYRPRLSVIMSEDSASNNTLDDAMCPNAGDSDVQTEQWLSVYGPPIAERLNNNAPGANLTNDDVYNLISLCPFDTVAKQTFSPFCNLFTIEEFKSFEYSGDLDKYYGTGYGQPLGPVQGVGYINELLARLTGQPVQDSTQTNHTLDDSPTTFPLNRTIYADFSHDNQMIAIYAAMGLFRQAQPPDPTSPDPARNWLASHLVPFSAKLVVEKLVCSKKEYVRAHVNDALQPLEFCGSNKNSLCTLDNFKESQGYARNNGNGDFEKCFD